MRIIQNISLHFTTLRGNQTIATNKLNSSKCTSNKIKFSMERKIFCMVSQEKQIHQKVYRQCNNANK